MARFVLPVIHDNKNGWGPSHIPEQFKDTPYQPFSKGDRLGKVSSVIMQQTFLKNCETRMALHFEELAAKCPLFRDRIVMQAG